MFVYISIISLVYILYLCVRTAVTDRTKRDRLNLNILNWLLLTIPGFYFFNTDFFTTDIDNILFIGIYALHTSIQLILWNIFLEIYFYFSHRFFHENTFLYKNIHKVHHTGMPNSMLDVQYVHPIETLLITIPSFWLWPIIIDLLGFKINLLALILMNIISTYNNIQNHIIDNFHMTHHKKWQCNYGTTSILDKIMKTYQD